MMKKPKKGLLCLSNFIACVLLLCNSSPIFAADTAGNTLETATSLAIGVAQPHKIDSGSDEDWFYFDAKPDHGYEIKAYDVGRDVDIALELIVLEDGEQTQLKAQNRGFEKEEERIDVEPHAEDRKYYVRVIHTGFFGPDTGYTIRIEGTAPVNQAPVADFSFEEPASGEGTAPLTVKVDGSASTDDGEIKEYNWRTSDGETKSGKTASFTFPNPGTYTITLTVTDNEDVTGQSTTHDVKVTKAPKLLITGNGLEDDGETDKTISVLEGAESKTFTVKLSPAPTTDENVTVTITRQPADREQNITLNPEDSFTLTSDNDYQKDITLKVDLDDDPKEGQAVFTVTAKGVDDVKITVTEEEPPQTEEPKLEIQPTEVFVPEGGNAQFTVTVSPKPTEDVQVTITPKEGVENDPDITLTRDSSSFTLTSPNYEQVVTLTAAKDADVDNGTAVFTLTAQGVVNPIDIRVIEKEPLLQVPTEIFVTEEETETKLTVIGVLEEHDNIDVNIGINGIGSSNFDIKQPKDTNSFTLTPEENTYNVVIEVPAEGKATITLTVQESSPVVREEVKVFVLPSLGTGTVIPDTSTTTTTFSGGVSVNDGAFEKELNINQGKTFSINGLIQVVNLDDVGENANFLTAINYEFNSTIFDENFKQGCYLDNPTNGWYLFINETAFYDCGDDIGGLLGKAITENAFTGSVALPETKPLPILPPLQLPSNSKLTVFFGYRLTDGTIVHSSQPIIVTVSQSGDAPSTTTGVSGGGSTSSTSGGSASTITP